MRVAKLKRFMARPTFEDELELHRVDCASSHGMLDNYDFLRQKQEEFANEPIIPPPLVTGEDLIALGLKPGPKFGEILEAVETRQLEGALTRSRGSARVGEARNTWSTGERGNVERRTPNVQCRIRTDRSPRFLNSGLDVGRWAFDVFFVFMRILMISAEGPPLARATALVDVLEALPRELRARKHEVGIAMPYYREIGRTRRSTCGDTGITVDVRVGDKNYVAEFLEGRTAERRPDVLRPLR